VTATLQTERLLLTPLTIEDTAFVHELVNTPLWIKFIGDRHINTIEDAAKYVNKLLNQSDLTYWVVRLKSANTATGVITLINRKHLDRPDIGFAFLPQHMSNGYAYESSKAVLDHVLNTLNLPTIIAITLPSNVPSIKLLEKLGLSYEKKITEDDTELLVYAIQKVKPLSV
jgi:ribosomal-protein-alanine N-acetyltransferase